MSLDKLQHAEDLARSIQKRQDFIPCLIDGVRVDISAMEGNTFGVIGISGPNRPDETLSWMRLENAGARLHADKNPSVENFYVALVTWDTMVHQLIYGSGTALPTDEPEIPQAVLRSLWKQGGL